MVHAGSTCSVWIRIRIRLRDKQMLKVEIQEKQRANVFRANPSLKQDVLARAEDTRNQHRRNFIQLDHLRDLRMGQG